MSNSLQQIQIEGKTIWVEVSELATAAAPSGSSKFANTSAGASEAVTGALGKAAIAETLQALVTPVYSALKAMAPNEANLELTLGFGVKGDVFVAKGEANAALKVSVKWKFDGEPG